MALPEFYITSYTAGTITKIADGHVTEFVKGLKGPYDIVQRPDGFYVSCFDDGKIIKVDFLGNKSTFMEGLKNPVSLIFATDNSLYVSEYNTGGISSGSIAKRSPDGTVSRYASKITAPAGMFIEADEQTGVDVLYVINYGGGPQPGIYKITDVETYTQFATYSPMNLPFNSSVVKGKRYIVSGGNGKIFSVDKTGKLTCVLTDPSKLGFALASVAVGDEMFVTRSNSGTLLKVVFPEPTTTIPNPKPIVTQIASGLKFPCGIVAKSEVVSGQGLRAL